MADSGSASCRAVSQVERSRGTTSRAIADAGGVDHGDDLFFRYVMSCQLSAPHLMELLDKKSREFRQIPNISYTNETLVRSGFLGVSPNKPNLAISIELLEIYRQLRRVCPRFSFDALARALCHIHHVRISLYY